MSLPPTPTALREATGISMSYASMILGGSRQPARPLAIRILRTTGWRHPSIADLSTEQLAVLESVDPWSGPQQREKAAA